MTLIKTGKYVITEFGQVPFGKKFRFNKEWCKRIAVRAYEDSEGFQRILDLYDLVVVDPEECRANKNILDEPRNDPNDEDYD